MSLRIKYVHKRDENGNGRDVLFSWSDLIGVTKLTHRGTYDVTRMGRVVQHVVRILGYGCLRVITITVGGGRRGNGIGGDCSATRQQNKISRK